MHWIWQKGTLCYNFQILCLNFFIVKANFSVLNSFPNITSPFSAFPYFVPILISFDARLSLKFQFKFKTKTYSLTNPNLKLKHIYMHICSLPDNEFFVDRDPGSFNTVLNYHRLGLKIQMFFVLFVCIYAFCLFVAFFELFVWFLLMKIMGPSAVSEICNLVQIWCQG